MSPTAEADDTYGFHEGQWVDCQATNVVPLAHLQGAYIAYACVSLSEAGQPGNSKADVRTHHRP